MRDHDRDIYQDCAAAFIRMLIVIAPPLWTKMGWGETGAASKAIPRCRALLAAAAANEIGSGMGWVQWH